MGYGLKSRTELHAQTSFQQPQFQPKARRILISWARAREYRDGETGYLQLARSASDPDARDRFIGIAQHYRSLAMIEQRIADHAAPNLWSGSIVGAAVTPPRSGDQS